MNIQPFLPEVLELSGTIPDVWNAICSHAGHTIPLGVAGAQARFRWCDDSPAGRDLLRLTLEPSFDVLVSFVRFPFEQIFGTRFDVDDLTSLPEQIRTALTDGMVATLLSALPAGLQTQCRVTGRGRLDEICSARELKRFRWSTIRIDGLSPDRIDIILGLRMDDARKLLVSGSRFAGVAWPSLASRLEVDATFTLGRVFISLSNLLGLRAGDMIVLKQGPVRCMVRAARTVFVFDGDGQEWTCSSRSVERLRDMVDHNDIIEGPASQDIETSDQLNMDALPIALDFDIGRVQLPISEVQTWQRGSVVLLDPPVLSHGMPVTVRSNGRAIAAGDLVMIDDRLAVRLLRFNLGSAAVPGSHEGSFN